jgi:hypothetical protein
MRPRGLAKRSKLNGQGSRSIDTARADPRRSIDLTPLTDEEPSRITGTTFSSPPLSSCGGRPYHAHKRIYQLRFNPHEESPSKGDTYRSDDPTRQLPIAALPLFSPFFSLSFASFT